MTPQASDPQVQQAEAAARQYAENAHSQPLQDTSWFGSVAGAMTGEVQRMTSHAQGLAAMAATGQFAVSPDLAQAMSQQFDQIIDTIDHMQRTSRALTVKMPLGGGYAEQISDMNVQLGQQSVQVMSDFKDQIATLKEAVLQSVANYRSVDEHARDAFRNTGGTAQ
jgi:hypothetical protein